MSTHFHSSASRSSALNFRTDTRRGPRLPESSTSTVSLTVGLPESLDGTSRCSVAFAVMLKNVVLVTNMWGDLSPEDGEARENDLSSGFFKPVLDKHAQMVSHHDTTKSTHDIIRRIMKNHPLALQIQIELVD